VIPDPNRVFNGEGPQMNAGFLRQVQNMVENHLAGPVQDILARSFQSILVGGANPGKLFCLTTICAVLGKLHRLEGVVVWQVPLDFDPEFICLSFE
jgi:hypothetical protein